MEIIIDMLLPTVLYLTRTVYRERDRWLGNSPHNDQTESSKDFIAHE